MSVLGSLEPLCASGDGFWDDEERGSMGRCIQPQKRDEKNTNFGGSGSFRWPGAYGGDDCWVGKFEHAA